MYKGKSSSFVFLAILGFGLLASTIPAAALAETCTPYSVRYVSGPSTAVEGGGAAVPTYQSPHWAAPFPGATWIWSTPFVSDPNSEETETFVLTFTLPGTATSSLLRISADDYYVVSINGTQIDSQFGEGNFLPQNIHTYQDPGAFVPGTNTVSFEVVNAPYFFKGEGTDTNNPAGLMFDLSIAGASCTGGPSSGGGDSGGSYWTQPSAPINSESATSSASLQEVPNMPTDSGLATARSAKGFFGALAEITSASQEGAPGSTTSTTSASLSGMLAAVGAARFSFNLACFLRALLLLALIILLWLIGRYWFKHKSRSWLWRAELAWYVIASLFIIAAMAFIDRCPLPYFIVGAAILVLQRISRRSGE
ncbi:MAG: hypothetical protein ACREGH_00915 [Minisyncoccia bacterium]